jgi:hypothetical protein
MPEIPCLELYNLPHYIKNDTDSTGVVENDVVYVICISFRVFPFCKYIFDKRSSFTDGQTLN